MKSLITLAPLFAAVLAHGIAYADPQDAGQRRCIIAMNKGMARTAKIQLRANAQCIRDFASGENLSASACYSAPAEVAASEQKTCDQETQQCPTPPTLGPTGCSDINSHSDAEAYELANDLLGAVPDSAVRLCETDQPGCSCQAKIFKTTAKLYSAIQKQFVYCVKELLTSGDPALSEPGFFINCLDFDYDGKVEDASARMLSAITKSCSSTPVPFAAGECAGMTDAALQACIESRVRCRVCVNAQAADNFGDLTMCDNYDYGPADSCGNGL